MSDDRVLVGVRSTLEAKSESQNWYKLQSVHPKQFIHPTAAWNELTSADGELSFGQGKSYFQPTFHFCAGTPGQDAF